MVHGAKLAWASQMGYVYVGAFGTNLHPDSKKRTLKASAGSPELRVHGTASTASPGESGSRARGPREANVRFFSLVRTPVWGANAIKVPF